MFDSLGETAEDFFVSYFNILSLKSSLVAINHQLLN